MSNRNYRHSEETKRKIGLANSVALKGYKQTAERKKRQSAIIKKVWADGKMDRTVPHMVGERNPNWKGDKVGYDALHDWIYSHLGSPKKCEQCGKLCSSNRKIHWANKSGKYLRKLSDWIRLCVSCHKKYDMKKLLANKKTNDRKV